MEDARDDEAMVPELVGLVVRAARARCNDDHLVLLSANPDGQPLGGQTWPGRWVVTSQMPDAGARCSRGDAITITFRQDHGGALDREPRTPLPNDGWANARASEPPGISHD
jgi:hypothetical protein